MSLVDAHEFPEDESDSVLLTKLLAGAKQDEPIIVVTDCSFREGWTPFVFRLSHVEQFAIAYRNLTNECVISGLDVVLICRESKILVLYDHEGKIATVGR